MSSENGYAGALFFALMSLGALVKLENEFCLAVGAVCAILAAISLRAAVIKSAQVVEENHQRIEIQFQQLRSKVNEASGVTVETMTSVNDAARIVQENVQEIRVRLAELDNLTQIAESLRRFKSSTLPEKFFSADDSAAEKNFERLIEIQTATMTSAQLVQESLQEIHARLTELDKLAQIVEALQQLKLPPPTSDSGAGKNFERLVSIQTSTMTSLRVLQENVEKIYARLAELDNLPQIAEALQQLKLPLPTSDSGAGRNFERLVSIQTSTMTSVNDAARVLQENLQKIYARLAELDNLPQIAESLQQIKLPPPTSDSGAGRKLERLIAIQTATMSSVNDVAQVLQENLQEIRTRPAKTEKIFSADDSAAKKIFERLIEIQTSTMTSLNDTARVLQKNLQEIHSRPEETDNLPQIVEALQQLKLPSPIPDSEAGKILEQLIAIQTATMTSAQLLQENFQEIRVRLAELDSLPQIFEAIQQLNSTTPTSDSAAEKKLEQLIAIQSANKASLHTILKLVQLVAQLLNNQTYSKDLEKINSSVVMLAEKIK